MRVRSLSFPLLAAFAIAVPLASGAGESPSNPSAETKVVSGKKNVVRPELGLKEANDAFNNGDLDRASELLSKADAMPNKTEFEQYVIDTMRKAVVLKMAGPAMTPKPKPAQ
jgi:hypothetical protein